MFNLKNPEGLPPKLKLAQALGTAASIDRTPLLPRPLRRGALTSTQRVGLPRHGWVKERVVTQPKVEVEEPLLDAELCPILSLQHLQTASDGESSWSRQFVLLVGCFLTVEVVLEGRGQGTLTEIRHSKNILIAHTSIGTMPAGSAQTLAQTRTRGSERKSQIELKHRTAWAPTDSAHTSYHICLRTHYAEPGTDIPTREGIGRYARSSTNSTAELLTVLPRWYRPAPRHYWTACGRCVGA